LWQHFTYTICIIRSKGGDRKKNKRNNSSSNIDRKTEQSPKAYQEKKHTTNITLVQIKDRYENGNQYNNVESCNKQSKIVDTNIEKECQLINGCKEIVATKDLSDSDHIKKEKGKIIFSKIEDIPTRPDSPMLENENQHQHASDCEKIEMISTRLKFEINVPQKRNSLTIQTSSTFAELSNRLGPTVNFNQRKLGINHNIKNPLLETKIIENRKVWKKPTEKVNGESTIIAGTEIVQIDNDETEEVVFLKSSKSRSRSLIRSKSRSRSYSYSHSRSRSYSRSSYSRSRSRSYSRSRSRSYSSYSSRSRSRSRSPSIQRRRGSPSFLDKRRITSARKRPIPYHRPTPSPTPSCGSSCSRSPSRSRGRCRSGS